MEREPEQPSELDTYLIGARSLRAWYDHLTHDADGNDIAHQRTIPASRYATTPADAAWYALALQCVYVDSHGEPDDPEASMDWAMGLVVNDHDDVATLVREYGHAIPREVMEHLDLTDPRPDLDDDDEDWPELTYTSPRDEALHQLWRAGWANESDGEEGSFTGRFARISNSEMELPDLERDFGERWRTLGVEGRQMLGHFVLGHSTDGEAQVMELPTEDAATLAFTALRDVYIASREGSI